MIFARRAGVYAEYRLTGGGRHAETDVGMNLSLDGYIAAPGDDLGWSVPSDELFQWWSEPLLRALHAAGSRTWTSCSGSPASTPTPRMPSSPAQRSRASWTAFPCGSADSIT